MRVRCTELANNRSEAAPTSPDGAKKGLGDPTLRPRDAYANPEKTPTRGTNRA